MFEQPIQTPRVFIADIQDTVSGWYNIQPREMRSERRSRMYARPRQVAMWLARELTGKSLPEIGRYFGGRDHTTVIHALRMIEKLRREDAEMLAATNALRAIIVGQAGHKLDKRTAEAFGIRMSEFGFRMGVAA